MAGLLGPNGLPISSQDYQNKKGSPPVLGDKFGNWAGRDIEYGRLPGGGVVQFDLSQLNISDFRAMLDHYQVNASQAVLSFMQHQSDWHLEGEDQKIVDHCTENLRNIWTPLNRSLSQANWAGFSPNALDWENQDRKIVINKVKDLLPEECEVKWDLVDGYAPPGQVKPKHKIYGGIRQAGSRYPIPVENSLWYPMLMQNGDYYGKKLLRPAFQSWFFSIIVHLFANRYYERFGEPTPVGRAPFEEDINLGGGSTKQGNVWMLEVLQSLRNRSVVVLPNDKSYDGTTGRASFDYEIEYLESQMRGADFERYLSRLDEEISLALFTPVLLMRTSDVGSYNLGVGHMQVYLWMLNAMNDDRAVYIDKYMLRPMTDFNFSEKAPAPKIVFRKLGNQNAEMLKDIIMNLISAGKAKVSVEEIGQLAGMTLTEIKQTVAPQQGDPDEDAGEGGTPGPDSPPGGGQEGSGGNSVAVEIYNRIKPQVVNAFARGDFGPQLKVAMGYKRRMERELQNEGLYDSVARASKVYNFMDDWMVDAMSLGAEGFGTAENFMGIFKSVLDAQMREARAR